MTTQRLTFTVSLELVHEAGPVVARGFLARELGGYIAEMLGPGESFVVVGDGRVSPSDYRMANAEVELTNGSRTESWHGAAKTTFGP